MIVMSTKDINGGVFVKTDQIDGETDWKYREAIKTTQDQCIQSVFNIDKIQWKIRAEKPSCNLYDF